MHDVPTKLNDALERRTHVRDPKVRQREPIARPSATLVQPERRPVAMRLDSFSLGVAPRL